MTGGFCAPRCTFYLHQTTYRTKRSERVKNISYERCEISLYSVQFYLWLIYELAIHAQELIHTKSVSSYRTYSLIFTYPYLIKQLSGRLLLETVIHVQIIENWLAVYGIWRLTALVARSCHWTLFCISWIVQSAISRVVTPYSPVVDVQRCFRRNVLPPSSGSKRKSNKKELFCRLPFGKNLKSSVVEFCPHSYVCVANVHFPWEVFY
jgi:hypothetical protein